MRKKYESRHIYGVSRTIQEASPIEKCDQLKSVPLEELNSASQSPQQRMCSPVDSLRHLKEIESQMELNLLKPLESDKKRSKISVQFKKFYVKIVALTFFSIVNGNYFLNLLVANFEAPNIEFDEYETSYQRNYQTSLESNIRRGMNIMNAWSGCDIAAWVYNKNYEKGDCKDRNQESKRLYDQHNVMKMRDGDTLYVPFTSLNEFSVHILPKIETKFVLITSELDYDIETVSESIQNVSMPRILKHPKLLHWFSRDIGLMLGITPNSSGFDEMISSFPVGLKPHRPWAKKTRLDPIPTYRKAFVDLTPSVKNKTNLLYYGYLQTYEPDDNRNGIPRGKRLEYSKYLAKIAESRYVLSPNGKKPDCHRHYEAIGLGTVPITELNPVYYRHVKNSPFVFGNKEWEIDKLTDKLSQRKLLLSMSVRNMVFEEYYMEYIEDVVGRPLRWWDIHQSSWSMMRNFVDAPSSFWNKTMQRSLEETLSILLDH